MEDDRDLVDRVHDLSDLELAILLSLVSREHCVIGTPESAVDSLVDEVELISQTVFGLRCAVVDCHSGTTLGDFATSLLLPTVAPSTIKSSDAGGLGRSSYGNGTLNHRLNGSSTVDYFHLSSMASQPSGLPGARTSRQMAGQVAGGGLNAAATSPSTITPTAVTPAGPPLVANVVVARNLNMAPEAVQIQALELLRTRRIFTATAMQAAPRPFLLVAVVAAERGFRWDGGDGSARDPMDSKRGQKADQKGTGPKNAPHMTAHLNDSFSMGHWHDPGDGYPNLEDREAIAVEERRGGETTDSESVVRWQGEPTRTQRRRSATASVSSLGMTTGRSDGPGDPPTFSEADIDHIAALSKTVRVDMEVLRYQSNVVAFLRMHRAVAVMGPTMSGTSCVSPRATKHLEKLAQCLAPLHRLDYISPALVALAARKTYLHRIRTVPVGHSGSRQSTVHERSMQWGSEKVAVEAILEGMSPEDVIDDVLAAVVPPV